MVMRLATILLVQILWTLTSTLGMEELPEPTIASTWQELQHFGTILWTYLNSTNVSSANWFAKTAVFTPAPISTL
jgi:hypothetical protein